MKIFKMIRGFFLKRSRSSKIMQNLIFHVKLLSPTLKEDFVNRHPKDTGVATVEGRPHEAVYMCFEKNYADFFVSTFHGEVLRKSASFNWVTWFN